LAASFSPDGKRIVTASEDNTAQLWDAATGRPLAEAIRHSGAVLSAAFSPNGRLLVTASLDCTARVWIQPAHEQGFPFWTRTWVEAIGTNRFDPNGALVAASPYQGIPSEVAPGSAWAAFARWFQQTGAAKTISPNSSRTYSESVVDRIREGTPESLREAYSALPGDPLVKAVRSLRGACLDSGPSCSASLGEAGVPDVEEIQTTTVSGPSRCMCGTRHRNEQGRRRAIRM
jgi:hypothetical protein